MSSQPHPVQPLYVDDKGVIRFKPNTIVRWLCDSGRLNLNDIAIMSFPDEDRQQIAQLLGYSLSGYGDLSYVDDEAYTRAELHLEHGKKEGNTTSPMTYRTTYYDSNDAAGITEGLNSWAADGYIVIGTWSAPVNNYMKQFFLLHYQPRMEIVFEDARG